MAWIYLNFESLNFLPKSLGLKFLTRISVSWRVSEFTIRHPHMYTNQNNLLANCWLSVGHLSADCWPTARRLSADQFWPKHRPTVSWLLVICQYLNNQPRSDHVWHITKCAWSRFYSFTLDEILNAMSFSHLALGLICSLQTEVDVVCMTGSIIDVKAEQSI